MSVSKLITREGVTVSVAEDNNGTPSTYQRLARVSGQVNINDTRNSVPVTDFDVQFDAIVDQIRDGRTVSLAWNANLVLDDPGYILARAQYESDSDCWVRIEETSRDGSISRTREFFGGFTQFNETLNESGVGTGAFTFTVSDVEGS